MQAETMHQSYRELLLCQVADRTAVLLLADIYARLQLLDAAVDGVCGAGAG